VLALDEHQVAIVVGDVVGQGAAAAAVMGQLRTVLAAYLLDDHGPAAALERLDRLAVRIPGALASTAAVMIVDLDSGRLSWARAGHPPPLLVESEDVRYLAEGAGGPLGVTRRPPYREAVTRIEPGACVLLYTDGLIERRGQVIDEGLNHLATTATKLCAQPPTTLLDGLLAAALPDTGPADDIALIAARYLPAPLHQQLPAEPAQLPRLRRAVRDWADAGAAAAALGDDLQITVGRPPPMPSNTPMPTPSDQASSATYSPAAAMAPSTLRCVTSATGAPNLLPTTATAGGAWSSSAQSPPTSPWTPPRKAPKSVSACPHRRRSRQSDHRQPSRHRPARPKPRYPPNCTSTRNPTVGGAWSYAASST
jgi:hypothetical protein